MTDRTAALTEALREAQRQWVLHEIDYDDWLNWMPAAILAALDGWTLVPTGELEEMREVMGWHHGALGEAAELSRLRKIEKAAREHGLCTCKHYPGYPRGGRHAPECDDDPELRAALDSEVTG